MLDSICTVTTPAKSRLLAALSDVKLECGITGGAEDAALNAWLKQASAKLESETHRTLVNETFLEIFRPITGLPDYLTLAHYPLVSISSITENDWTLDADDYEVDADTGALYRLRGGGEHRAPWHGFQVQVAYSAGYTAGQTLPADLARAYVLLVKQYRFAQLRDPLARNVNIAGAGSTSYFGGADDPSGLGPEIEGLIAPYKY